MTELLLPPPCLLPVPPLVAYPQVLKVLQEDHNPDLELMLGGELSVTVHGAYQLSGNPQ